MTFHPPPKSRLEAAQLFRDTYKVPVHFAVGKDAKLPGWPKRRPHDTTDGDLANWFGGTSSYNLGGGLGEQAGGTVDQDLDCPEAVIAASILSPPTGLIFGRPSHPASHRFYKVPDPERLLQFFDPLREKNHPHDRRACIVELRGNGHQTILPLSVHPDTGEVIAADAYGEIGESDWPTLARASRYVAVASLMGRYWPRGRSNRHHLARHFAGAMVHNGVELDSARDIMRVVCRIASDEEEEDRLECVETSYARMVAGEPTTGFPELKGALPEELAPVVGRLVEWLKPQVRIGSSKPTDGQAPQPKKPATPPLPYKPFPTEALPEPLALFVREGAAALGCDPSYLALPALAVVAGLVGNTREIRLKRDWHEPSVLWTAAVGDSGTLKSPAQKKVMGPVYRLQKELIDRFKLEMEEYEKAKAAYDERAREAKKEKRTLEAEPPEKPILPRLVTGDVTIEKLAQLLEDNPRGLILSRDELGGWLGSFSRYKGKGVGSDLPNWLEIFRAETLVVDRKTGERPTLYIPRAAVSVNGTIQPGALARALTPEYFEAGMPARLLMCMPPRRVKQWTEAEVDPETQKQYEALLRRLLDLQMDKDACGDKVPFVVKLTPEAKAAWVAFYGEWAKRQAGVGGEMSACLSKLEGIAARLALLHHLVTHVEDLTDCDPIEPVSIEAGVTLAAWFAYEAERIYTTIRESDEDRQTRRLIEFIRSHDGKITSRQLHRSNKSKYPTVEAATAALDELVQSRLAEWEVTPTGPKGGRPSRTFRLTTLTPTDKTDETPEDDEDEDDFGGGDIATKPPTKPPSPCMNPQENGGFVGFVNCHQNSPASVDPEPILESDSGCTGGFVVPEEGFVGASEETATPEPRYEESSGQMYFTPTDKTDETSINGKVTAHPIEWQFVQEAVELQTVLAALDETERVALDVETSGLDTKRHRVRLLQLHTARGVFVLDLFAPLGDLAALWAALAEKELIVHNSGFDLAFLIRQGMEPREASDILHLSRLLTAGTKDGNSLADLAQRHLDIRLDKDFQKAKWTTPTLPHAQLDYAAKDAIVTANLYPILQGQIIAAGLERVAQMERQAMPAVLWMMGTGVPFDRTRWEANAQAAEQELQTITAQLDELAPARGGHLVKEHAWNWSSPQQVGEVLRLIGIETNGTDDATLAAIDHPIAGLLRRHRSASKRVGTYGKKWLKHVHEDGRVYPNWKQLGAVTGRMSCGKPNMQQLPRGECRRCFAATPGRALIKCDWSQLHLRIIAGVAPEPAMQKAFEEGIDIHTATARQLTGREDVTREERQLAKVAAFGLCYGMGKDRFLDHCNVDYGLNYTFSQSEALRRDFFRAYPGLKAWHRRQPDGPVTLTAPSGRRCQAVEKFSDKLAYQILLIEADCLKTALGMCWQRRQEVPGADLVIACHDELVMECIQADAEAIESWLVSIMLESALPYLAPVPVEVTASIGTTWGGGEIRAEKSYQSDQSR
jgi:DNA polymerase I-like protein with 3'-5' exonuclease and polymerase domains